MYEPRSWFVKQQDTLTGLSSNHEPEPVNMLALGILLLLQACLMPACKFLGFPSAHLLLYPRTKYIVMRVLRAVCVTGIGGLVL